MPWVLPPPLVRVDLAAQSGISLTSEVLPVMLSPTRGHYRVTMSRWLGGCSAVCLLLAAAIGWTFHFGVSGQCHQRGHGIPSGGQQLASLRFPLCDTVSSPRTCQRRPGACFPRSQCAEKSHLARHTGGFTEIAQNSETRCRMCWVVFKKRVSSPSRFGVPSQEFRRSALAMEFWVSCCLSFRAV